MRKTAIIVDIDNTILDSRVMEQYIPEDTKSKEGWNNFHDNLHRCVKNSWVYNLIYTAKLNYDHIFFLTSREDTPKVRSLTELTLKRMNFKNFTLIMRPEGNYFPQEVVKAFLYNLFIKPTDYKIEFAIDDNEDIIGMWKSLGINTLKCDFCAIVGATNVQSNS